ncbi:uncharacterized protein Bfra_008029 [Botrytis fragariae]|uniref:Uncharacterized protein n=1 Tax=Botrytis fragariae TaxID=1964551 RepID=A0A8H6AQH7_9HELO|nr:uncharacterized protein Bfra_008029 [Botrytis fragariae]KAF5871510.1 hypothetical protein Bfra_008029 [Botrytis fragariae]
MPDPSNGFGGPPAPSPLHDPFAGKVFEVNTLVYWTNPTNLIWIRSVPVSIRATILKKHENPVIPASSSTYVGQARRIADAKVDDVDDWYDIMLFNGATKYRVNGKELSWRPVSEGLENTSISRRPQTPFMEELFSRSPGIGPSAVPQSAQAFKTGDILFWTGHKGTTPPPSPQPPSSPSSSPPLINNSNDNAKIRVTVIKKHETVIAAPRSNRGANLNGTSTISTSRTIKTEEVGVFYDIRVDAGTIVQKVNGKKHSKSKATRERNNLQSYKSELTCRQEGADPTKVIFKRGARVHWTGKGETSTAPTSDIQTASEISNVTMNRDLTSEIHSGIGASADDAKFIPATVRSERIREEICPEEGRENFNIRCCYMIKLENGEVKKVEEGQLRQIAKDR